MFSFPSVEISKNMRYNILFWLENFLRNANKCITLYKTVFSLKAENNRVDSIISSNISFCRIRCLIAHVGYCTCFFLTNLINNRCTYITSRVPLGWWLAERSNQLRDDTDYITSSHAGRWGSGVVNVCTNCIRQEQGEQLKVW